MLPNCNRIAAPVRIAALLLALPCLALFGASSALAQSSVRGSVAVRAPQGAPQAVDKAAGPEAKAPESQPKFPNKDTAINRRDYDMGTETGSIRLGRDEDTGDTVMSHKPPKKAQQPSGLEGMPIEVRPIIVR